MICNHFEVETTKMLEDKCTRDLEIETDCRLLNKKVNKNW